MWLSGRALVQHTAGFGFDPLVPQEGRESVECILEMLCQISSGFPFYFADVKTDMTFL